MTQQNEPSSSSYQQPPSPIDSFIDNVRKLLIPSGATAGVAGAFWSLFGDGNGDIPKAIASAGLGFALSIGSIILGPLSQSTKRRAKHTGDVLDSITEQVIASATGFEGKYLYCQASECESVRSEGVNQREGIFEPLLKDVFVELQVDTGSHSQGFHTKNRKETGISTPRNQTIWDLLTETKNKKTYRQIAILAWGGYGKTTLLKHVAYRYGISEIPIGVPKLIPVLLVLRKYKTQLSQNEPPSLPELINKSHIPDLPEAHRLQPIPPNWAKQLLESGKALVMFDGFDEVPKSERPAVASWINSQMHEYQQSVFVVASRPKAYKEQDEADRLIMSMSLWVQPFDDKQRRKFIENWYLCQERLTARRDTPEVRNVASKASADLLGQVETQPELKDLAKNPLLLNMISTFHRLYPRATLPKRQVDLYEEICTLQLKARPKDRRLETLLLEIEPQPILEKVAFLMMQKVLKRIDTNTLITAIRQALDEQGEAVNEKTFLKDVVQISELLVQQEDEYEFAHLNFQEYLAAAHIAKEPKEREHLLYAHVTNDWWKTTILLYAGKAKKPAKLIREAMNQGAVDLAYACLQQTNKKIEDDLREELEHLATQVKNARYVDLENHLKNQQWERANDETYKLMITEVGKEEGQRFTLEEIMNFPCEPLKIIDTLWLNYSKKRFGFSIQKKIYIENGGDAKGTYNREAFIKLNRETIWNNKIYSLEAPTGHLPSCLINQGISHPVEFSSKTHVIMAALSHALEKCEL